MNWDRYDGLALPTAPEVLPRVTERMSDLRVLLFIRKHHQHERHPLYSSGSPELCPGLSQMVYSGIRGLPGRDLQSLTDSSLPALFTACQAPLQHSPKHAPRWWAMAGEARGGN